MYFQNKTIDSTFPLKVAVWFPIAFLNLYNHTKYYNVEIGGDFYDLKINKTNLQDLSYQLTEIFTDDYFIESKVVMSIFLSSNFKFRIPAV